MFDKKRLSERDICTKFITPALESAGWDLHNRLREEVTFTAGQIRVRGRITARGKRRRADYLLYHKPDLPIALIEAKDNTHPVGAGMQQALAYGETLDIPFVFTSNGDGFLAHDRTDPDKPERELPLSDFPSPTELWQRYREWKGWDDEETRVVTQDYYVSVGGKTARYYQRVAINRAVEAIARGQNRVLLVMATGTGKTYTAFQIIYRLWKSGTKKRILFLADRNILVDQARRNDFKPFGGVMTKIKNRKADPSYEVYLALYQAITGPEEDQKVYKKFSPDFFDLIVVDECHRGSAKDDSAWREILDYFSSATQLGMTATPRETKYVSNAHYFGDPVYTYSLKQGIQDGFLAPYKVIRIDLDKDAGWRPEKGKRDKHGREIPDKEYGYKDYDGDLVLERRTAKVAELVTEFLKGTDRYDKTIVFCRDTEHAGRMRQALVNHNGDIASENRKYVMQITGNNPDGVAELDSFIDPESRYPVIATTSRLLSTGVDAQTCKLIVLDQNIESLSLFKQIIGRGTRIQEDYGKLFFTIMDFRRATQHFADPKFDGLPEQIYEPDPDGPVVPPDPDEDDWPDDEDPDRPNGPDGEDDGPDDDGEGPVIIDPPGPVPRQKYYVRDVTVDPINRRVQYLGPDGKLITESLRDYTRNRVHEEYASLDDFLRTWTAAEQKQAVLDELEERGILFEALAEDVGRDYGPFDLICHVAWDRPPLTRRERADNVRKRDYFTKYADQARAVLDALLEKYADEGIENIEDINILKIPPFDQLGTPLEIVETFGGKDEYLEALHELEAELYKSA